MGTPATRAPWWASPVGLVLGFLLPMYGVVSFAVHYDLTGLTARGIPFLDTRMLLLGVALLFVMALGGWLGQFITTRTPVAPPARQIDWAALAIGIVALLSYLMWFRDYLLNPGRLFALLLGQVRPSRLDIELVTGVTSLANITPVFFTIYAWRRVFQRGERFAPWMTALALMLAACTLFRVYAWSERLALIEAALPVMLLGALGAMRSKRRWLRALVPLAPFLALPVLLLFFGLAESVRSWTSSTYFGKLGFWEFVIGRLASYYYTSLNNGAGLLAMYDWPPWTFHFVLGGLHTAPLSVGALFNDLVGSKTSVLSHFLRVYGDPEFNNPSGLYTVVFDLGLPLAIVYFAVTGFMAGALYRRYASGMFYASLAYPMFFIMYLEVFRYPYLGSGRALAWAVGILVVVLLTLPVATRPRLALQT